MYRYYEFEVSLQEAKPRMWRRFLLRQEASFFELHMAIQDACGWGDCHLFAFKREPDGPTIAGIPDPEESPKTREPEARRVKLASIFEQENRILYEYDFGDGWMHEITRVGTLELPYKFKRALLAGARAFPPEDSGGVGGYERLVTILETGIDPWGDDVKDLRSWIGDWRPDHFEFERVKAWFDK